MTREIILCNVQKMKQLLRGNILGSTGLVNETTGQMLLFVNH